MLDQMATHFEGKIAIRELVCSQRRIDELLCWLVVEGGHSKDVQWLLQQGIADFDARDADGDPVVCLAAAHGDCESLGALIDARANLDVRDNEGVTPLVLASIHGYATCVEALLAAGAAIGSRWQYLTPVQWASHKCHDDCVARFTSRGVHAPSIPAGHDVPAAPNDDKNRLRPPPSKVARLRRKAMSAKAAAGEGEDGAGAAGGASAAVSASAAGGSSRWPGHMWVRHSLLEAPREEATRLRELYPCMKVCVRQPPPPPPVRTL